MSNIKFQLNGPRVPGAGYVKHVVVLGSSVSILIGFALGAILVIQAAWPSSSAAILPDPGDYALPETEAQAVTQTLALNVGGSRIAHLDITDVEAGKGSGLTNVLTVGAGLVNSVQQYIYTDEVLVDNLHCKTLTLNSGEAATLVIADNEADGNSFTYTIGTPAAINLGGSRGEANIPQITGESYDEIVINAATDATIRQLTLKDINTFGGACVISHLKAGTVTIKNSTIGSGSGINSADFIIGSTFTVGSFASTDNVETAISVR